MSTLTAIVVSVVEALTDESAADVAVSVVPLVSALLAPAGTSTRTHRSTLSPGCTVGVVLSGVVQPAANTLAVQVLDDETAYESAW